MSYFKDKTHHIDFRVYYEDTDAGGIVYNANYLKYAERARTEMLRLIGLSQSDLREEYGILFVVRRAEIDFKKPALLDDIIRIETVVESKSRTSFIFKQHAFKSNLLLADMKIVIVCINEGMKPVKTPEIVIKKLVF